MSRSSLRILPLLWLAILAITCAGRPPIITGIRLVSGDTFLSFPTTVSNRLGEAGPVLWLGIRLEDRTRPQIEGVALQSISITDNPSGFALFA
jgi:hypothetical protein